MNERLKQSNYELHLYNKELDSFIWITSHDLKEPLRKTMTFSSLIEEGEKDTLSAENKKRFAAINRSLLRMQQLLNGLVLYYDTTLVKGKPVAVDLNEALEKAERNLSGEIGQSNAVHTTEHLPIIKGYPDQIKELFINIISNSLKFRQDNLPLQITTKQSIVDKEDITNSFYKRSSKYHKIVIADNGLGFDEVYKEKVFGIFQRVHQLTSMGGIGVGLTICKKIMENHHGFINVSSRVGKGTTIELYFPVLM